MSLTLTQIQDRVRRHIRDDAKSFITDAHIIDWANDAQLDLASRLELLQKETTGTMGGAGTSVANGTIDLPSGTITVILLRLGTDDDAVAVDDDTFYSWSDSADTPDATLYRVFNEKIEMYPKPTSGTAYVLRTVKAPTNLSAGSDTSALPDQLHVKLTYYCLYQANMMSGEQSAASEWLGLYEQGLPSPPTDRVRLHPGPMFLTPAAGYFQSSDYLD